MVVRRAVCYFFNSRAELLNCNFIYLLLKKKNEKKAACVVTAAYRNTRNDIIFKSAYRTKCYSQYDS